MNGAAWPDGVTALDHTADVGLLVRAPSLEQLFHRAAAGMLALVAGAEERSTMDDRRSTVVRGGAGSGVRIVLDAPDREVLLVAWLREILHLLQARDLCYSGARFEALGETRLVARLAFGPAFTPVMELKGVTYHALEVRHEEDGWFARVVFDV